MSATSANQQRQEDQAMFYRAGDDRRKLNASESVSIYNAIKIWEPGVVVRQTEPRTYVVNRNGRELFRTREHLKHRQAALPPVIDNILVRGVIGAGQAASQSTTFMKRHHLRKNQLSRRTLASLQERAVPGHQRRQP